jgi:hypothetical protein
MVIKRIEPMSLAKVCLVVQGLLGLLVGAMFSVFGMLIGGMAGLGGEEAAPAIVGMLFGVGAIVVAPIFYGVVGFIFGFIGALIYNLAAGWMGGLQIEAQ